MQYRSTRYTLWVLVLALIGSSCLAARSVSYERLKIGRTWLNVVTADLNAPGVRVTPAIARCGIGTCESFRSMLRRTRPAAAIDGTFFCTRSLKPTGDIVIDGQMIYRGYLGIAIGFGPSNSVHFTSCDNYKWTDYESVLVAGPSLLLDGKMAVYPWDQGFRSGVHFSPRIRAAIGLTSKNKLVLLTTLRGLYLSQLARVMQKLGCVQAAVLDGGSSTGLYWNGRVIHNPSRAMTNCLLIYDDPDSYEQHRGSFYPVQLYSKNPPTGS
jgi:hypothetical protein